MSHGFNKKVIDIISTTIKINYNFEIHNNSSERNKIFDNEIEINETQNSDSTNGTRINSAHYLEPTVITNIVENISVAEIKDKYNQIFFKKIKKVYRHDKNQNIEFLKKIWCTQNRTVSTKHDKTRLIAIKFLRHILRKIFYGNRRNITETYIVDLICNTFGPCTNKQKFNLNLKSKVYDLNENIEKIIRMIYSIKTHLQKFDENHINCNKSFNCDVQLLTYIFNTACSLPTTKSFKSSVHVNGIKQNTYTFIASVDHFIDLFNDIFTILRANKTVDSIVDKINNETSTSLYNKLKIIINKYDLAENKFIKAVLETLPGFMDKISTKETNDKLTVKGNKTLEKEFADTIIKLKKLQDFIQGLKNNTNRRKRHISDTDGLEFVLSTIEYWFKRKAALEPEEDGIDLLVEVIKNAPDVIEIQKSKNSTKHPDVTRTPVPKPKTTAKKKKHTISNPLNLQYEDQRFYPHFQKSEFSTTSDRSVTKAIDSNKNLQFSDLYQYIQSKNKQRNNISHTTPKFIKSVMHRPKHRHSTLSRMTTTQKTTTTTEATNAPEKVRLAEPDVFPDAEVPYPGNVFIQNSHGQDRWADNFIDRSELMKYPNFYDDKSDRGYAKSDDFDVTSTTPQYVATLIKSTTYQHSTRSVETTPSIDSEFEIRHFKPDLDYEVKKAPELDWVDERFTNVRKPKTTTRSVIVERTRIVGTSTTSTTPGVYSTEDYVEDKRKNLDIIHKKNLNFLSSLDYEEKEEATKDAETGDDFKK